MAKATTTVRQRLQYQPQQAAWFAATQALFNRVAAFYFEVIQAHEAVLDLSTKEALTALEKLTHTTEKNPHPVMPLSQIASDIPAMFRRAAIHAALGSARSFFASLSKWRAKKEKAQAKGKKFMQRPPVPLVRGTSLPHFTPVNGRIDKRGAFCSKSGRGRVGVGSNVGSLGGKCLLVVR